MENNSAGVWVKCSERMPARNKKVTTRFIGWHATEWHALHKNQVDIDELEWLDETTPTFTLEQAVEIFDDVERDHWLDKKEYFKTKFNVEI